MKRDGLLRCARDDGYGFARNSNQVKIVYSFTLFERGVNGYKIISYLFLLGSLFVSSAWAWTVPLEESGRNNLFNPSISAISQEEFLMDSDLSEDLRVPEPLPNIKPLAEQNIKAESASSTLALPGENVFSSGSSENKTYRGFKKQASTLTGEEQVTLNYAQALECINKGRNDKAKSLLLNNLAILPSHLVSRLELAHLYLKSDQDWDAEQVVKEGLGHQQHPELLKLMAMVMERRGELKLALEYLNKVPSQYKNDKNTVVLLGQLYQQTGNFGLAKKQYDRLLEAEPNNPLWVLGIAMALEGQGKKREALKNYLELQSNPILDASISQYIAERIASLKG